MKRVYRHESIAEVGLVRGLLEQAGIACLTKNEQLSGALGEIPVFECQPELWVIEEADAPQAEAIVAVHLDPFSHAEDWVCEKCGEPNEGQFGACWQCSEPDRSA